MTKNNNAILASNNNKKIKELTKILQQWQINVLPQAQLSISEAVETGVTFVENALIKARHAAQISGMAAIADDSGLVVPALNGQPGVYSARYAGEQGDDAANNAKLLQALSGNENRQAYYVCVIVYLRYADDPLPLIAQGLWHGEIAQYAQGQSGFGYDPLFWLPERQKTAAQLAEDEKNRISHRAMALQDFQRVYRQYCLNSSC